MNTRRLTFADTSLDTQAERMVACYAALAQYDTAGIKSGAVKRLVDAALRMTAQFERLEAWCKANPDKPYSSIQLRQKLGDLGGSCRHVLEAKMDLKERD